MEREPKSRAGCFYFDQESSKFKHDANTNQILDTINGYNARGESFKVDPIEVPIDTSASLNEKFQQAMSLGIAIMGVDLIHKHHSVKDGEDGHLADYYDVKNEHENRLKKLLDSMVDKALESDKHGKQKNLKALLTEFSIKNMNKIANIKNNTDIPNSEKIELIDTLLNNISRARTLKI